MRSSSNVLGSKENQLARTGYFQNTIQPEARQGRKICLSEVKQGQGSLSFVFSNSEGWFIYQGCHRISICGFVVDCLSKQSFQYTLVTFQTFG